MFPCSGLLQTAYTWNLENGSDEPISGVGIELQATENGLVYCGGDGAGGMSQETSSDIHTPSLYDS